MQRKTDFTIEAVPTNIRFLCPNCRAHVTIPWGDLDVPEYWGDDWGQVDCPDCGAAVELGDYEYD